MGGERVQYLAFHVGHAQRTEWGLGYKFFANAECEEAAQGAQQVVDVGGGKGAALRAAARLQVHLVTAQERGRTGRERVYTLRSAPRGKEAQRRSVVCLRPRCQTARGVVQGEQFDYVIEANLCVQMQAPPPQRLGKRRTLPEVT
jgi:hypothetical protein